MSERNAVFGADLSGGYYFQDIFWAESGILAFVHVINVLLTTGLRLSELIRPLHRYSSVGPLRFQCKNTDEAIFQITEAHRDAAIEQFDGLTFRYPDWWFNVRPFAADRTLNIMLESRTKTLVDQKLSELSPLLGDRA